MEERWLIIPVEVKHREFHARIILSALAASRGYHVLLGKDTMIRRLAPSLPRGVVLDKSLGTARHGKPQRFARLGYVVVVMDEESTGYYGSPEQFLSVRLAPETLEACSRWYCISDAVRDHANRLYPEYDNTFVTTGLMRTDSWRGPFRGFYETERKRIAREHGPFILFNSNFGGIIHARGDQFVAKQIRQQKKAWSQVEERMAKIFAQGHPNLQAFVDIIPKVAEWFPSHKIVVRPHPSETVDFWTDQFEGHSRISVSNTGVVTPWILASSMMFHHGCTTGIEATMLGKPNVMYAPHPDEHHDTEVMRTMVPIVQTSDELKAHIAENLDGSVEPTELPGHDRFFANLDGTLVCETILADIDRLAFASGPLSDRLPASVRLRLWAAKHKNRSERERTYMKQKWPGTNTTELEACLAIANKGLGLSQQLAAREVYDEVWQISAA